MSTSASITLSRRWTRAGVSATSSYLAIELFVGAIGALPVLPGAIPTVLVISTLAGGTAASLRPMAWYFTVMVGAAIGFAGAFIVAVYAISRI